MNFYDIAQLHNIKRMDDRTTVVLNLAADLDTPSRELLAKAFDECARECRAPRPARAQHRALASVNLLELVNRITSKD